MKIELLFDQLFWLDILFNLQVQHFILSKLNRHCSF